MADIKQVLVPDVGADSVDVTEILIAIGDQVEAEQGLISVEGDKAAMEIPAPFAGKVVAIKVAVGDKVSEGTLIVELEEAGALSAPAAAAVVAEPAVAATPAPVAAAAVTAAPVASATERKEVTVPDVGADSVDVTEVLVAIGDVVEAEQGLISVEGDKAAMEVPAPFAGTVVEIKVAAGGKVSQGDVIVVLETGAAAPAALVTPAPAPAAVAPAAAPAPVAAAPVAAVATVEVKQVLLPDVGSDSVDVTEVLVAVGDRVEAEQGLISVEGDKAAMEVPAPFAGVVKSIAVAAGDKVGKDSLVATIEVTSAAAPVATPVAAVATAAPAPVAPSSTPKPPPVPHHPSAGAVVASGKVHATPAVRRVAREFGVDLAKVKGTGRKGRILKEDVQAFVKYELSRPKATNASVSGNEGGLQVLAWPKVDYSKFGEVEKVELSRIQKISGPNLHRNWVVIPHVTQFDEADITELEEFRKQQNLLVEKRKQGAKISPLIFILKAAAKALTIHPKFCSSLSEDGEHLFMKKYVNIGVAVDTPNGLIVPVIKNVDKKGIFELAEELGEISKKARAGQLKGGDMQGSCFTISSLGGIGGTQFTPIVNAPDVAILGVSKSDIKPKWNGKEFEPRLMLPMALSYDHRVIDGADGARFITTLNELLSDIRTLVL